MYYDEVMPGTNLSDDLFLTSLAITNPLGLKPILANPETYAHGSFIPWSLIATCTIGNSIRCSLLSVSHLRETRTEPQESFMKSH